MEKKDMINVIKNYIISSNYNVKEDDLNSNGIVFVKNNLIKTIKIISWYNSIIVSCSHDLYEECYNLLKNKTREEIFEMPYVYGQSIYYIPDLNKNNDLNEINDFNYKLYYEDVSNIRLPEEFKNVGEYDTEGKCTSKMLYCAYKNDELVGVASAEQINDKIWELGIDVNEKYREKGLGTYLSKVLTKYVLDKGIVPIWCSSSTNISSQITAYKSGFIPLWIESYGTIFDDNYGYKK